MTRRGWVLVAASAIAVLALGAEVAMRVGGESAERRVRRYFDVRGPLDTASLRAAVLREIPIGSAESRLTWYADSARLGADGSSVYRPAWGRETAVVRIDEKPAPLDMVTESYIISFGFDGARRLREVHVRHALTGP